MIKIKKLLTIISIFSLGLFLTGCIGVEINTKINDNLSGTVTVKTGVEKGYEDTSNKELKEFNIEGKTYIGYFESSNFTKPDEFKNAYEDVSKKVNDKSKSSMKDEEMQINFSDFDDGIFDNGLKITKLDQNTFRLEFNINVNSNNTTGEGALTQDTEALAENVTELLTFDLPMPVYKLNGLDTGLTINNNNIKIDLIKVALSLPKENITYSFICSDNYDNVKKYMDEEKNKTQVSMIPVVTETSFTDVLPSQWHAVYIEEMARGGLVEGFPDKTFRPNGNMSVAEFCQVLARATSLGTGSYNGYWAGTAINECREKGFIRDRGEITSVNYGVPITREEAIFAMQKASNRKPIPDKVFAQSDIPDVLDISEEYRSVILEAYNSGLTTGMDDKGTCNPKGILSRAQVCALFYRAGWTYALDKE